MRNSCDQCEYVNMKFYIEGVRYPWDQCEYTAADQSRYMLKINR